MFILSEILVTFLFFRPDSGDCPETSFRCPGGRCLPPSWRCNGQVECLDGGLRNGFDEAGCDDYTDYQEALPLSYTDRIVDPDAEKSRILDKSLLRSTERYPFTDPWDLEGILPEQPTQKELVVTPTPIEWPCGGLLQTFYGTFSSPSSVSGRMFCLWTLDPQDPRPLRLDLQQIILGPSDRLTIYNQEEGKGEIIKNVRFFYRRCMQPNSSNGSHHVFNTLASFCVFNRSPIR